jgi:hypothetical protein
MARCQRRLQTSGLPHSPARLLPVGASFHRVGSLPPTGFLRLFHDALAPSSTPSSNVAVGAELILMSTCATSSRAYPRRPTGKSPTSRPKPGPKNISRPYDRQRRPTTRHRKCRSPPTYDIYDSHRSTENRMSRRHLVGRLRLTVGSRGSFVGAVRCHQKHGKGRCLLPNLAPCCAAGRLTSRCPGGGFSPGPP